MKKVFLVLMLILGINVFAEYAGVGVSRNLQQQEEYGYIDNSNALEYHVVGAIVKYENINKLLYKGSLIIQDDHGRFYMYSEIDTREFYRAIAYGYTDINVDYLIPLDTDSLEEIEEMSKIDKMYLLSLPEALEIIEKNAE